MATSSLAFVGRVKLLAQVREAVSSGLDVWLTGEAGVGKTALAKRAAPDALYVPHCTPTKELLTSLLVELQARGFYEAEGDEEPESEAELRKLLRKLDARAATNAILGALRQAKIEEGREPVIILDDFEGATATSVRAIRQIAAAATVICCGGEAKSAQKPFLFQCTRFEVPRLSRAENETLAARLLDDYGGVLDTRERPRLLRQIVEQSQGLPSVTRELVKRTAARGDLTMRAVQREELHGARTVDMTPGLIVIGILLVGWKVAMKPLHDTDMSVIFGFSGAGLMLIRLFAFRLANRGNRR